MIDPELEAKCQALRVAHVRGRPLVLPNAWDAASARSVVAAGFSAVATTSGGVASSLGFDDHEGAPVDEMFAAAARIARSVEVPVTVDLEAGYGLDADEIVQRLIVSRIAGINLEDTDHSTGTITTIAHQASRLATVREAAAKEGYSLVLNARIDLILTNLDRPQGDLVDACVERARAYFEAGADCVYPIFLAEPDARQRFISSETGAVNLLILPNTGASIREFAADGVARLSFGTSLHRATMKRFADLIDGIFESARPQA
jgi:2-methylisocitrate lyase-like PEP mutase family enzyme